MNIIFNNKKEIIISLLTGVIVFYAEPILNYIGNIIINLFIKFSSSFSKNYYSAIAFNDESSFSETNNLILVLLLLFFFGSALIFLEELRYKIKRNYNFFKDELKEKDDNDSFDQSILKRKIKSIDKKYLSIYIILSLIFLGFYISHIRQSSINNENLIFKNKMIILAPYTEGITILKLKSDWAKIRCKSDFENLNKKIDSISKVALLSPKKSIKN